MQTNHVSRDHGMVIKITPYFLVFLSFLLSLTLLFDESNAQTRFTTPSNNATGVSTEPTITLRTALKIDTASLEWVYRDTSIYEAPILIIPKHVFDTIDSDEWHNFNRLKTITFVDDSTLDFEPYALSMAEEFVVIVNNITLVENDTEYTHIELADSIKAKFTITLPSHELRYLSLFHLNDNMRCGDTIQLRFNRKISSLTTAGGPLISCEGFAYNDSVYAADTSLAIDTAFYVSSITTTTWIDALDSSIIYLKSSSFSPGNLYRFRLDLSRITGDSSQDMAELFEIKKEYTLSVGMTPPTVYDTLPAVSSLEYQSGIFSVDYNDTIKLRAPEILGDYIFSHWESEGYPSVDNSTAQSISIISTCSSLTDISINAFYNVRSNDSVATLSASPSGAAGKTVAYNPEWDSVTISTGYKALKGTVWHFRAKPAAGYKFSYWSSNSSLYNNSTNPIIHVRFDNVVTIQPIFVAKTPAAPGDNELIGTIFYHNITGFAPTSVAYFQTPNTGTSSAKYTDNPNPANHTFTVRVAQENFGISYYVDPTGLATFVGTPKGDALDLYPGMTWTTPGYMSANPPNYVDIHVDKLKVKLEVQIAMEDGTEPPGGLILDGAVEDKMWVKLQSSENLGIENPVIDLWAASPSGEQQHTYLMKYYAGVGVKLTAGVKDGYEFVEWSDDPGFNAGLGNIMNFNITPRNSVYRVKAIFRKKFKLEKIWVDKFDNEDDNTIETKGFAPDQWGGKQREIGFEAEDGKYVRLMFDFNQELDPATASKGIRIVRTIMVNNEEVLRTNYPVVGDFGANAVLSNGNKRLEWTVDTRGSSKYVNRVGRVRSSKANIALEKIEEFRLYFTDELKNTDGNPLVNPGDVLGETITPNVQWVLDKIKVDEVMDGFNNTAELYSLVIAAITYTNTSKVIVVSPVNPAKIPAGTGDDDYFDVDQGDERDYDVDLLNVNRIRRDGQINVGITNWDKDGDVNFEKIATVLSKTSSTLETLLKDDKNGTQITTNITKAAELLKAAMSKETGSSGWGENADDGLGSFDWYAARETRWGSRSYTEPLSKTDGGGGRSTTTIDIDVK